MPLDAQQFAYQLATKLSPPGALARALAAKLRALWLGVADEPVRLYGRVDDLLSEAHPATVTELLEDWEREFDLPDPCVTSEQDLSARRAALLSRLSGSGGQSRQYFIELAETLGIAIDIVEDHPFEVGRDGMGDGIGGDEWAFTWEVFAPVATPMAIRELMECVFERRKPAHTQVWFHYV